MLALAKRENSEKREVVVWVDPKGRLWVPLPFSPDLIGDLAGLYCAVLPWLPALLREECCPPELKACLPLLMRLVRLMGVP